MISRLSIGLKHVGILLLSVCLFNYAAWAQYGFKLDDNRKRVTLPFNFIRNLIIVRVKVNNKGPYNFVLDTGVGLMIITDPNLVDSLNLKNKRSIQVTGMGEGKDFEAYVVPSLKVDLNGISGQTISAAILKKDEFGLSNYAGMPIHGLLGYDFFNSFAVKINFNDSTVVVGQLEDLRIFRRSNKLPISIEENKPYINARVKIGNRPAKDNKLILDIGAGHPLSLENLVDQNNGLPEKFVASNLGVSLTGPIRGYLSRINEFEIGRYKLKNVIVSFPEFDPDKNELLLPVKRDGNMGMELLKKFNFIIDYQSKSLYLKSNAYFGEPFEQDMSGLEYYSGGPDLKHIIIGNVEKGSAGAEIGLQKGDEIVSINFKPVVKMSLEEIDKLFCSKNDRSLLLEIYHDHQYDKVILVLKRRV